MVSDEWRHVLFESICISTQQLISQIEPISNDLGQFFRNITIFSLICENLQKKDLLDKD